MTGENQPGPEYLCNTTCGFNVSRKVCFFFSYRGGHDGATVQGRGNREVRDVQGGSMHNESLSSAPSADCSEVFEMEGEFQVKGSETYTSTPFCCFPLRFSQFNI